MSIDTITTTPTSVIWRGYGERGASAWADKTGVFEGAIPIEKVRDELFGWTAVEGDVSVSVLGDDGVTTHPALGRKGIVRSDTGDVLGLHSTGYGVHQFPDWLLTNVGNLIDDDLQIGGAGLFKKGAVAFVQVEMPESLSANGIEFRPSLVAATSHDGSIATTYQTTNIVVICTNTMHAAIQGGVKVRHTVNSVARIADVREALGLLHAEADGFAAEVDRLTSMTVTDSQWQQFVEAYTGLDKTHLSTRSASIADRKARDLNGLWNGSEMVAPFKGTAFGAWQAVSTAAHHLQTVRGATRGERNTFNTITGVAAAADAKALALLERVLTTV